MELDVFTNERITFKHPQGWQVTADPRFPYRFPSTFGRTVKGGLFQVEVIGLGPRMHFIRNAMRWRNGSVRGPSLRRVNDMLDGTIRDHQEWIWVPDRPDILDWPEFIRHAERKGSRALHLLLSAHERMSDATLDDIAASVQLLGPVGDLFGPKPKVVVMVPGPTYTMHYAYHLIEVYDRKSARFDDLTVDAVHCAQGFVPRGHRITFMAIEPSGSADIIISYQPYAYDPADLRVVAVTVMSRNGDLWIDSFDESMVRKVVVAPGRHLVTLAQRVAADGLARFVFHIVPAGPSDPEGRVLVADDQLRPPADVLETFPRPQVTSTASKMPAISNTRATKPAPARKPKGATGKSLTAKKSQKKAAAKAARPRRQ